MPEPVGHGQDEDKRTARAMLAAALLDYDRDDSASAGPSANAQTSAMLAPLRHLLIQRPPSPQQYQQDDFQEDDVEPDRPRSRTSGWFGRRASTVLSGGLSDRGERPKGDQRRSSSSASGSAQHDRQPSSPSEYSITSPVGFERRPSLASGYGTNLGFAGSGAGSEGGAVGGEGQGNNEEEERLADEWGLNAILTKVSNTRPTTPGGSLLPLPRVAPISEADETRSAPDLDQPRHPAPSTSASAALTDASGSDAGNDRPRPRIKILERKPGQPALAPRPHTMLEPGKLDFPDFNFDSPSNHSSGGGARDDPLINPAMRTRTASYAGSQAGGGLRTFANSPLAASPRALSPGTLLTLDPTYDPSGRSTSPPPSASGSGEGERTRRVSTFSMGPTKFTSRHDPAMIALAKAEIEKERPQFVNKTAGAPPQIVLMPAPLAGRPPSPPPKIRAEGPESESEHEEGEEEELEEVEAPRRPAGALYGRSLMDVLGERQAQMKGRQKQYVRHQDGRATMHDWADSPAARKLLENGRAEGEADPSEAGDQLSMHRAVVPRSKSTFSVFGPDLIYQKEMEHKRVLDAIEAKERAEREAVERAEEERVRAKEEKKRRWGKKKKGDRSANASEISHDLEVTSFQSHSNSGHAPPSDPYAAFDASQQSTLTNPPATPPRMGHTLAPSLSLPQLGSPKSPNGDWSATFAKPDSPPAARKGWDADSDSDDDHFKPRPQSRVATLQLQQRLAPPSTRASSRSPSRASSPALSASQELPMPPPVQSAESLGVPSMPHSARSAGSDWTARSRPETVSAASEEPLAWRYGQQPPKLDLGFDPTPEPALLPPFKSSPPLHAGSSTDDDEADDAGADSDSSDEIPLGMRRAPPKFADEDEAPLGLLHGGHAHRLAPAHDSDEDDLPLGFKHQDAHFQQQQQHQYQAQMEQQLAYEMAVAQQVQQQQAVMAAQVQQQQFFAMQMAQQQMAAAYEGSVLGGGGGMVGMGGVGMGPHPAESVDRWRREVSG